MTAIKDPYPESLSEVDDAALGFAPDSKRFVYTGPHDPLAIQSEGIKALNRIAIALEQLVLERVQPVQNAPQRPALAALPPVAVQAQQAAAQGGGCPVHNVPWKTVPAGITKRGPRAGQPYDAFLACSVAGCEQRPPR